MLALVVMVCLFVRFQYSFVHRSIDWMKASDPNLGCVTVHANEAVDGFKPGAGSRQSRLEGTLEQTSELCAQWPWPSHEVGHVYERMCRS
ncbi:hypothetical protein EYC84_006355 [Monilinia fructicola]|uniref:Secreted protein n=1 Tax=Monilinia fructicola TaxID=38448 RepID=A0A5M9K7Z9_MONFR|nr:hypothetical protein EYC84_006355 [Monilinia fructicola]